MPRNAFDKKQTQEQIRAEKDIDSLLRSLAQELRADLYSKYDEEEIVKNLTVLVSIFGVTIDSFWDEIESVVYERSNNVAQVTIDKNEQQFKAFMKDVKKISPKARKADVTSYTNDVLREFDRFRERSKRFTEARKVFDDKTIGQRIKIIKGATKKTVQNIVAVGIENGKSARDIAKEIDGYVNPVKGNYKSPFDWYRERFRGGEKTAISSSLKARGYVREGSVSYQAQRIARTEINMTQREITRRVYEKAPFVKGFRWNLSLSHPHTHTGKGEEICEKLARTSPHKTVPETPHPNCLCYITTELVKPETFLKNLKKK